jgi:hypothetical protein
MRVSGTFMNIVQSRRLPIVVSVGNTRPIDITGEISDVVDTQDRGPDRYEPLHNMQESTFR